MYTYDFRQVSIGMDTISLVILSFIEGTEAMFENLILNEALAK